jgi:uncharacterized Zn finger protein (UPF0148 family)
MSADQIDVSCGHGGQALSAFLHEMAEKNAKVVCPSCGESRDGAHEEPEGPPAESGRTSSDRASSDRASSDRTSGSTSSGSASS